MSNDLWGPCVSSSESLECQLRCILERFCRFFPSGLEAETSWHSALGSLEGDLQRCQAWFVELDAGESEFEAGWMYESTPEDDGTGWNGMEWSGEEWNGIKLANKAWGRYRYLDTSSSCHRLYYGGSLMITWSLWPRHVWRNKNDHTCGRNSHVICIREYNRDIFVLW